jgi:hypothetical protein
MRDLRERWTTFLALLQAAVRVVRGQSRVLVFPLLAPLFLPLV